MKNFTIGSAIFVSVLVSTLALSYGMGWFSVFHRATVSKAHVEVDRKIWEESPSYVEGKRQEAVKLYREWSTAKTAEDKEAVCSVARMQLANIPVGKLHATTRNFYIQCMEN